MHIIILILALDYPVSETEILSSLKKLKSNTAVGFDFIPFSLFKDGGETLAPFLALLFNECLSHGSLPEEQHLARIVSFCKPGKPPDNPSSYRNISILVSLLRILDGIISERVYKFAEKIIHESQGGFRRGIGTNEHFFIL